VARLATADLQGQPHLVVVCFALAGDTLYSAVDHKPKRGPDLRRLANLRANPSASVLVDHYEEDWARLWWVRADGEARVLDPGDPQVDEERRRALGVLANKYRQYVDRPPEGPVISVSLRSWRAWEPR
jgi:PPOX class probable F420-dependent enzyme